MPPRVWNLKLSSSQVGGGACTRWRASSRENGREAAVACGCWEPVHGLGCRACPLRWPGAAAVSALLPPLQGLPLCSAAPPAFLFRQGATTGWSPFCGRPRPPKKLRRSGACSTSASPAPSSGCGSATRKGTPSSAWRTGGRGVGGEGACCKELAGPGLAALRLPIRPAWGGAVAARCRASPHACLACPAACRLPAASRRTPAASCTM